jgi:hypothetical protein
MAYSSALFSHLPSIIQTGVQLEGLIPALNAARTALTLEIVLGAAIA